MATETVYVCVIYRNHMERKATSAHLVLKTLAADLLRFGHIPPVNVGSVMIKSRSRHSHHITVDALNTGLQKQNFHPPIQRQPAGEHTASCACSNCEI